MKWPLMSTEEVHAFGLDAIRPYLEKEGVAIESVIEGKVLEEYWFGDEDLEPDAGGPLSIEPPTRITPRPLSVGNRATGCGWCWADQR